MKIADKLSDAVAYLHTNKSGHPCALVFYGKQSKPVANYRFRAEAEREATVRRYFEGRQSHAARVVENRSTPSGTATRNASIKRALEAHYGKGKVRVTGGKGTAYGWVQVHLAMPRPALYAEERSLVLRLITEAGITLGHYDSGDYGSGYELSIDFA